MDKKTRTQLLEAVLSDADVREHLHGKCGFALVGHSLIQFTGNRKLVAGIKDPAQLLALGNYEVTKIDPDVLPDGKHFHYSVGDKLVRNENWSCGLYVALISNKIPQDVIEALAEMLFLQALMEITGGLLVIEVTPLSSGNENPFGDFDFPFWNFVDEEGEPPSVTHPGHK